MRIDFTPYSLLYTDNVSIYDVSFIIIDEENKTIDASDQNGMMIAYIHYENEEEIGYLTYNNNDELTGNGEIIVKCGELVI